MQNSRQNYLKTMTFSTVGFSNGVKFLKFRMKRDLLFYKILAED